MPTEKPGCDVIGEILEDPDTVIEALEKIRRKIKWFHAKTFRQTQVSYPLCICLYNDQKKTMRGVKLDHIDTGEENILKLRLRWKRLCWNI